MKRFLAMALACVTLGSIAFACNIPVFRFALERWQADTLTVSIVHRRPLSTADQALVEHLAAQMISAGGNCNFTLSFIDLNAEPSPQDASVRQIVGTNDLTRPRVIVQWQSKHGRETTFWNQPLDEQTEARLIDSPARKELQRRLLRGDSIVWLVIPSPDLKQNQTLNRSLDESFKQLEQSMTLPEGIGLLGSELFSNVPLLVQFSRVELDRNDEREAFLLSMLTSVSPDAFAEGEPLLVPVFGRGRALEVIPASVATKSLIEDLSVFLGAACSCQVKEQNPGFDLCMNVNWNLELFGEDGEAPPESTGNGNPKGRPVILSIPPGRSSK